MSPKNANLMLPPSVPSGPAQVTVVSAEFIDALRQVGARPSLLEVLEKERIAAEQKRRESLPEGG